MTFSEWLQQKITESGLSQSEIARRGGTSHARISQVLAGEKPGASFCLAIARAFHLPPEYVLEKAGIVPPIPSTNDDTTLSELIEVARKLSPEKRQEVLKFALFRYELG